MTIDRPLFSIITVTRNNLDGLLKTQASIENQSAFDYEWIIIDGDSSDGTKDHLLYVSAQNITEPDKGIYDAMNKGIVRAKGQYFLFLNAGDALADMDILATLAKAIATHAPDFIYGDALESSGFYKKARSHENIGHGMFTHHQAMLYRHNVAPNLRYDEDLKIAADYGFTAQFLRFSSNIHYIPCAICIFENGGASEQNRALGRKEQFRLRNRLKILTLPQNIMIFVFQSATAFVREKFPELYIKLRTARARSL